MKMKKKMQTKTVQLQNRARGKTEQNRCANFKSKSLIESK